MIPTNLPRGLYNPQEIIKQVEPMLKIAFSNLHRYIEIDRAQVLINEFADYTHLDRGAVTRSIRERRFQTLFSAIRDKISCGQISIDLGAVAAIFSAASALRMRNE